METAEIDVVPCLNEVLAFVASPASW